MKPLAQYTFISTRGLHLTADEHRALVKLSSYTISQLRFAEMTASHAMRHLSEEWTTRDLFGSCRGRCEECEVCPGFKKRTSDYTVRSSPRRRDGRVAREKEIGVGEAVVFSLTLSFSSRERGGGE